jgi:hypothetical protein
VVSCLDQFGSEPRVPHCNDANCAGGDESIISPDPVGNDLTHTSLALDGSGNPVISHWQDGGTIASRWAG